MSYKTQELLKNIAAVSTVCIVIFIILAVMNGAYKDRLKRVDIWQASKQECLLDNPMYYCNSVLGVDYDHSPDGF